MLRTSLPFSEQAQAIVRGCCEIKNSAPVICRLSIYRRHNILSGFAIPLTILSASSSSPLGSGMETTMSFCLIL